MGSEFQNHRPNHRGGRDFAQLSKFTKFTKVAQEDPTSEEEEEDIMFAGWFLSQI